ncbi:lysosomal amino acid transporter 1 homolog isoform X3 [Cyclopterus lumpus]|uniref:lysosomal amino acid transporter 1 homolog isoform X3 n=1 Tax=Cyclopterus lumpus TaxID=8103 RepID=UPI0014871344|nr:lysosomal amino acid transporter 1 homolog isoform X3 [Cyclopterus lumpus]
MSAATQQTMSTDGDLARGASGWSTQGNFTSLCPNGSKWVWEGLGECAQDGRDMASIYLGLLSIVFFMVSSLPQYYSSCKTGNMDRALSIWFLLLWLGGDSCNLVGSFLADQLPLQTYTAVYYILADLLMLAMYFYYKISNKMLERRRVLHMVGVACVLGFTTGLAHLPGLGTQHEAVPSGFRGRALLSTADLSSIKFKRKSTEGVSFFLFALVILGNTSYGLSVLLKNPDEGQGEKSYIIHHLPWLIGSLGTLSLDLIISLQFLIYRKAKLAGDVGHGETTPLIGS